MTSASWRCSGSLGTTMSTVRGVVLPASRSRARAAATSRSSGFISAMLKGEAGGTGWVFGKLENGVAGYMSGAYLVEDENTPDADAGNAADAGSAETTTLRRSDGVYVTLAGKWTIAED